MHRLMGLNNDAASFSPISPIRCSEPDSFVGVICEYPIASAACFNAELNTVWEVFEFEFGNFGSLLLDELSCLGEAGSDDADESKHIINNDYW